MNGFDFLYNLLYTDIFPNNWKSLLTSFIITPPTISPSFHGFYLFSVKLGLYKQQNNVPDGFK